MRWKKAKIEGYHVFYAVFFFAYFFFLYFLLYYSSGFSPFQINIHFFSNVVGSISKRFMGEAAVYAFLFYLIHYSKRKWLRGILIAVFLLTFFLNTGVALYYFVTRTDVHWYVIRGFQWNLLLSYLHGKVLFIFLGILVSLVTTTIYLYRLKPASTVPLRKRLLFLSLFAGLIYGGNFFPMLYNINISIFASDNLQKQQYHIMDLDKSGLVGLANAFQYEYFKPEPEKEPLTEDEQKYIDDIGLEDKLTIDSDFHPKKVVLVVFENVNQSFLSYYNSKIPGATPFMDSLVERYPHIDAFYPSGTYTLYGLSSLLCSHINTARMRTDDQYECLPSILKSAGYATEFIRGFSKYYVHENVFFNKIGYDTITAMEDFDKKFPNFKTERPDLYNTWGFSDNYLFDETIKRLKKKRDENLFLTVLTVDTHANGGRCYRKRRATDYKNDVLFSVNCLDTVLSKFFAKLESEGLFDDDLLVILTSDHLYSSYSGIPGDNSWDSFSALPGNIPLIFISKEPIPLIADTGSQVDIAPTLLDLLNIEAPDYYMGKSLIANAKAVPMGQDKIISYMLIGKEFVNFNLNKDFVPPASSRHFGDSIKINSNSTEEVNLRIGQLRQEREMNWSTNSALLKWLKNQW